MFVRLNALKKHNEKKAKLKDAMKAFLLASYAVLECNFK